MDYFIERNSQAFSVQLHTFAKELPSYATLLGFSATEVAEAVADAAYVDWMVKSENIIAAYAVEFKHYEHLARHGATGVTVLTPPALPALDAAPALVAPGIQKRFAQKANKAKANPQCSLAIQQKLNIAPSSASTAKNTTAPDLKVALNAGFPEISFHKYSHQAVSLYRDKGDGKGYGSAPYKTLHHSPFVDKDLPNAGQTAQYKYKMVYLDHDEEAGDFSAEASIAVVGR